MSYPAPNFVPLDFSGVSEAEQFERADVFFEMLNRRRTVREYSDRDVPIELIEKAIAAPTITGAPSAACGVRRLSHGGAQVRRPPFVPLSPLEPTPRVRTRARL